MKYMPEVVQVLPLENYYICVYFSDGSIKKYDVKPLIERGGVFAQMADVEFFRSRLTVMGMTAAWDVSGTRDERNCIDIDPCSLYEKGIDIGDPLSNQAR